MTDQEIRIALSVLLCGYRQMVHDGQFFFQAPNGERWQLYQELPDWLHDASRAQELDRHLPVGTAATLGRATPREKAERILRARGLWKGER